MLVVPVIWSPDENQPSKYPFTDTPSAVAAVADIIVAKPVAALIIFDLFIFIFLCELINLKKRALNNLELKYPNIAIIIL